MNFSEYFNNYIESYDIPISKLSRTMGIDRATLHRYQNGERLPKNSEMVETLAEALCMNAAEKKEFLLSYDKTVLGEDIVNSYTFVHNMLEKLKETESFFNPGFPHRSEAISWEILPDEENVELYSSHDIVTYAMRMFKKSTISVEKKPQVMLFMQPAYTQIQDLLIPFFANSDVKVEQIVCYEKSLEKCYINLDIFKYLLPQSFQLKNFHVYYYYESLSNHLNHLSGFPNMIITESCAMMFDYKMETGFFTTNEALVHCFSDYFAKTAKTLFSLIEKGSVASDLNDMNSVIDSRKPQTLFNQLCIGPCIDSHALEEAIYPFEQKTDFIKGMYVQYGDWNGTEHIGNNYNVTHLTSYFTVDGIRSFAYTGIVDEFPEMYYQPVTVQARINIFKRMIILSEGNRYKYNMIKGNLTLPKSVQIFWDNNYRTVWFRHIKKDDLVQISIRETSVYNTIINAIQYIEKKDMIYSKKEFINFLNGLIEDLERK